MIKFTEWRWVGWLLGSVAGVAGGLAQAQPQLQAQQLPIEKQQRLSAWLAEHPAASSTYPLGLMWLTPEEFKRQEADYTTLLDDASLPSGLKRSLGLLKPTGRVPQAAANASWLEAYPKKDPLLKPGDAVRVPAKPTNLRVLREDGLVCEIPHKPGALANDYVKACRPDADAPWAWVVQADGRIQKVGLKLWNPSVQNEPAPGAWIWAPNASAKLNDTSSWHVARWLANQGVSNQTDLPLFAAFERQIPPVVEASGALDLKGRYFEPQPSYNDWGVVGLIQTPTARTQEAGSLGLTVHNTAPYRWFTFMFQPTDWMEAGFRYTKIQNRVYSENAPEWSHGQSYLDKSLDVKARLWRESDWVPQVAVGMRDVGGTGLFSSEYVVASKRTGRVDWSAGMAWGNMGARADLSNPVSRLLGAKYDQRLNDVGLGGNFTPSAWFRGRAALFGGVEYQTPWNFSIKAEYDGNNYQNEPLGNVFAQSTPINWALVYQPSRNVQIQAGVERGNTWSVGFTLYTDMANLYVPKVTAPPTPAVTPVRPAQSPNWQQTANDLEALTLWDVNQVYVAGDKLVVQARNTMNPYPEDRLNKALAVIHRDAPAAIETIEVQHYSAGDVIAVESVNRAEWVTSQTQPARTQAAVEPVAVAYTPTATTPLAPQLEDKPVRHRIEPGLDWVQTTGGPDGYLYQFQGNLKMGLELPWQMKASATASARLYDNYDNFIDEGASNMPRVRTYTKQFLTTSRYTLADMTLSKTNRVSDNWYATGYVGYFETMFGGAGGEVLYRQPGARWGLGADYNKVRMRDFHQNLNFQALRATTGHVTGYWETPFEGIVTSLSVGQYLAGDRGETVTLTKIFNNGTALTAYATKTNVPAAVFGEGSFDKGIALKIPFDAFLTSNSRYSAGWSWKPLVRDGGAILTRPVNLFSETSWLSPTVKSYSMAPASNDNLAPDDQVEPYDRKR